MQSVQIHCPSSIPQIAKLKVGALLNRKIAHRLASIGQTSKTSRCCQPLFVLNAQCSCMIHVHSAFDSNWFGMKKTLQSLWGFHYDKFWATLWRFFRLISSLTKWIASTEILSPAFKDKAQPRGQRHKKNCNRLDGMTTKMSRRNRFTKRTNVVRLQNQTYLSTNCRTHTRVCAHADSHASLSGGSKPAS